MAKYDAYHDFLRQVPLFADLDDKQLDHVSRVATDLDFEAGRVLMREGTAAHELFVVAEGTLEVTRDGVHIADIGAGGVAGELAVLNHVTRNSTVTAKTDVSLIHIDGREFKTLLDRVPEIAVKLLPVVAARAIDNATDHTQ